MINIPSQGAATPVGYSRSPHSSRPCVRVLEALVPRQSDEEEDDDFLLDRQEVRVTASLAEVREPICRMIVAAVHRRTIALLRTTVSVEFFKLVFV